jgi:hypothetical protein
MRWLLILIAVGAAGTAGYLGTLAKTSYSGYSREQLDMLERELSQELQQTRNEGSRTQKALDRLAEAEERIRDGQQLIQQERQRRMLFYASVGVAGLAVLAAFFVRGGGASAPDLRGSGEEDARLLAAMGDPAVLREGARQKAAALLGVSPDAPPAVIEAAFQAQLQQRDPARAEGLPKDLQRLVLQQREELARARELLLGKQGSASTDSQKQ